MHLRDGTELYYYVNHHKVTGKERDTEGGTDYFGARFYASR